MNILIKTDVQGSAEALKASLEVLKNEEARVVIVSTGVGNITESDILLAEASSARIIGFNVKTDEKAETLAKQDKVEISNYSIIYECIEDIEKALKDMMAPKFHDVQVGTLEVRKLFKVSSLGTIAGCYVTDGKVARNAGVRVIREGVVIHDGKLVSLKRFKDDAKEVSAGFECGIQIEGFDDLQVGDTIEAFIKEEIKR